jgi:rsbT co-antagonist protein RsbR
MRRSFDSDDRSAKEIKGLFGIAEEDLNIIAGLKPLMMGNMEELLKKWYGWAEKIPEYEEFFPNKDILERVQRQQLKYWDVFFSGLIDEEYLSLRRRLGETHARVGLPLDTYFAGADYFLSLFIDLLDRQKMTLKEYKSTRRALNKLVHLDMTIIVQSYEHLVNEGIAAQSKSLLEMSTPVTQIWNGILLLPVVGLIDSKRAQDIMNSTLAKISESQARSFILDISGVAVVDTAVANHLVKITKATRLMGCESTISGVSPAIAQTIVDLGIDVEEVNTTGNMRSALLEAFEKQGLEIKEINKEN